MRKISFAYDPLSTNQIENNKSLLNFYPNPTSNKISIINKTKSNNDLNIKIYSILGCNVLSETLNKNEFSEVDLTSLAKGVYTLNIQIDDISTSHKLIIN